MALEGIQSAIRQQVSERLNDITMEEMPFLGTLRGFDAFYKTGGLRFNVGGPLRGEALQVDFRTGKPTVRGINAMEPNFNQLIAPLQKGMNWASGTLVPSAFDCHETIQKYMLNRLEGSLESLTDYVMKTSDAVVDAIYELWTSMLFPPTNLAQTITTSPFTGAPTMDTLMAVAFPLQTGYANNAATGTGTYSYLGIDMNLTRFNAMKARNTGTVAAPFGTPSVDNLRVEKIKTINKRGRPDIYITDTETLSFLGDVLEDQVRMQQGEELTFGAMQFNLLGMVMMAEPRMDLLSDGFSDEHASVSATEYRESYMLSSKNHRWRNTPIDDFDVDDLQGAAALKLGQGYYEACYWNENPRHDARQFQLTGV